MIKVDLNSAPPSADAIDAERRVQSEALRKIADCERRRRHVARVLAVCIWVVVLVAPLIADLPVLLILAPGVTLIAIAVVVATTFGCEPWIAVPRAAARSALSDLASVDQARCPAILAWCQSDPVLARYQATERGVLAELAFIRRAIASKCECHCRERLK